MFYFEIKNDKTQETAEITAKTFGKACESLGWKPWNCHCVYRANRKED